MSAVAMCPDCGVPLIGTVLFARAEFFCRTCRGTFGFLEPVGAPETPELLEVIERDRVWFRAMASGAIPRGGMLSACATCSETNRPHELHTTEEEWAASNKAFKRLLDPAAETSHA